MARMDSVEITVPWDFGNPIITATPGTGSESLWVRVTVDNHGQGPVDLTFGGAGNPGVPENNPNPGDNTTVSVYVYDAAGTYTITATDTDRPDLTSSVPVTVEAPPADMVLDVQPADTTVDPTGMTVIATVDNAGQGEVGIWWEWDVAGGDPDNPGTPDDTNAGDNTEETTHQYATPGTYTVMAIDTDTPGRRASIPARFVH